jgi:hypothetical protein
MMTVPAAKDLASMVAMPAIAPALVGAGAGAVAARSGGGGGSMAWLAAANSNVALAPLTIDRMPIGRPVKSKYDDDLGDSKPYLVGQPLIAGTRAPKAQAASGLKMAWRKELGGVQKFFRKLNETAYLISVPFLLLILLGAIIQNRPLALMGATAVVLLNIGRIIAGVANLAVVPFRDGIFQGILFLIPPLTFFYLYEHWNKLKKPTMRIIGPIATMALVFLAFTFVPTLRKDGKVVGVKDLKNEIRAGAKDLKGEMVGEIGKAKSLDVEALAKQAEKSLGDAAGKINSIGQPGESGKTP